MTTDYDCAVCGDKVTVARTLENKLVVLDSAPSLTGLYRYVRQSELDLPTVIKEEGVINTDVTYYDRHACIFERGYNE